MPKNNIEEIDQRMESQYTVNQTRFDPYKNFKFKVKWDGKYIAGINKISGLKRTAEVIGHREGGDASTSRKSPGVTRYESITLERRVTHDLDFENWASKVWHFDPTSGIEKSLKDFTKDVILELYNEAGELIMAYKIYRCWISEYQALPELDANSNAIAIESIKLQNEGWERDTSIAESIEPSF
ncbi:MAG: phage tail protein [Nitrososphaeraceae archaeon]